MTTTTAHTKIAATTTVAHRLSHSVAGSVGCLVGCCVGERACVRVYLQVDVCVCDFVDHSLAKSVLFIISVGFGAKVIAQQRALSVAAAWQWQTWRGRQSAHTHMNTYAHNHQYGAPTTAHSCRATGI